MNTGLTEKNRLFIQNRDIMRKNFKMEYALMQCLAAYICADKNVVADPVRIKDCKRIIRENTSLFSPFKDISYLAAASSLSLSDDPEGLFKQVLHVYDLLKEYKFKNSTYLSSAAMMIAEHSDHWDYRQIVAKAARIWQEMKEQHPFLTSRDDYGYAVMLAMSDMEISELTQGMEDIYTLMKKDFFSNNAVQSLSHVLTLSTESAMVKRERTLYIYEKLKENKCKYGTGEELPTLGVLALFPEKTDELIKDIVAVNNELTNTKGFGNLSVGRSARLMYAASIVASEYLHGIEDITLQNSMSSSITKSIIAIQAAIIASSASAAAITASSAGSGS